MVIDKDLYNDIKEYCELNNLKVRNFIHKLLKESFLKEKYGTSPFKKNEDMKDIIVNSNQPLIPLIPLSEMQDIPSEIQEIINDNYFDLIEECENIEHFSEEPVSDNKKTELKKKRKLN